MGTIVIAHRIFPDWPIVVAANRHEKFGRPSTGWEHHPTEAYVFAPRDLVHKGTWIGINKKYGTLVAITNNAIPEMKGKKSRGQLALGCLSLPSVASMPTFDVTSKFKANYNGFHLVLLDQQCGMMTGNYRQNVLTAIAPDPGLHVVTERGFTKGHCGRANVIENVFSATVKNITNPHEHPEAFDLLLNFHVDGSPKNDCCVHDHNEPHKTISSSLIFIGKQGAIVYERNGFACVKPFNKKHEIKLG